MRAGKGMALIIGVAAIGILLAACAISPGPVPEDHFYRLPDIPQADHQSQGPLLPGRLAVKRLLAAGLLNERAILYVEADQPLELHRYRYHYWQNTPAAIIRENMRSFLRTAGVAAGVDLYEPGMAADFLVAGRLHRFELLLGPTGSTATVNLELGIESPDGNTPAWSREYSAAVEAGGEAMHDSVRAFAEALQQIYASFIKDLQQRAAVQQK